VKTDFFARALPWTKLICQTKAAANDLNLNTASRLSTVMAFILVASFIAACFRPVCLLAAAVAMTALVVLNLPVYRFFLRARGVFFTLCVLPWHWFYFLYGGVAFGIGTVAHALNSGSADAEKRPSIRPHVAVAVTDEVFAGV
jgi:hypothetical protein